MYSTFFDDDAFDGCVQTEANRRFGSGSRVPRVPTPMRLVAVGLALLVVSPPAAACPAPHLVDVPLIADGGTLLDDGGVVIETRNARGGADEGSVCS